MQRKLFDEVREGLEAIRDDEAMPQHEIPPPDVKAVRKALGMSQARLAVCLGVNTRTLRSWEQGRGAPEGR